MLVEFNEQINAEPKLFHGYRLLAVDGSDLTLPFNLKEPENIRTKNHCNFLHLNTLYDVCSRIYTDASFYAGTKAGEAGAAVELIRKIPEKYPVILIADRGYETYNFFAHIEERLFDYVVRIKDHKSNAALYDLMKTTSRASFSMHTSNSFSTVSSTVRDVIRI